MPKTTIKDLRERMERAAADLDFEEAGRLRDQLSLLRGAEGPAGPDEIDTAGLERQVPGSMGLGSSQQRVSPPAGWKPPARPDPMTRGAGRRARRG